jgi:hypothetical protein
MAALAEMSIGELREANHLSRRYLKAQGHRIRGTGRDVDEGFIN